jgi:hypothetical protein
MFQLAVNALGTLTAALCAVLLFRAYFGARRQLLLWSALCFAGLTLSNGLLLVDIWIVPDISLRIWRLATAAASMLLLVFGLVFGSQRS